MDHDLAPLSSVDPAPEFSGGPLISSFCTGHGCVGVAPTLDGVAVVDTKDVGSPSLHFTRAEWTAFVTGVKNSEFDLT